MKIKHLGITPAWPCIAKIDHLFYRYTLRYVEMDGVTLAKQIKEKYAHIPVTLLSSMGDEFSKEDKQVFT
jgi:hypothetical protein